MTNQEKIEFYRTFLNQMEKDFKHWRINSPYTVHLYELHEVLDNAENDNDNGLLPKQPHPRQLASGRIAKRWEWWLHKSGLWCFPDEELIK